MKKMKNIMALLLALVMTMGLVACGNKTSEEMCWMRMAMWSSRRRISPLMSSSPET